MAKIRTTCVISYETGGGMGESEAIEEAIRNLLELKFRHIKLKVERFS